MAKKEEKKDLPKTGGVSVGTLVLGVGGAALFVGGGLLILKQHNP